MCIGMSIRDFLVNQWLIIAHSNVQYEHKIIEMVYVRYEGVCMQSWIIHIVTPYWNDNNNSVSYYHLNVFIICFISIPNLQGKQNKIIKSM